MNTSVSLPAPRALVRSGLALADVAALPLLASAFLVVLGLAFAAVGVAAGGINFVLGLPWLDYFPTFPVPARILTGLSLLAFSALMVTSILPLWRIFLDVWRRFWSWHHSAWTGTSAGTPGARGSAAAAGNSRRFLFPITVSAVAFAGLLTLSFILMMALARGPFWHAWHWFQ